MCPSCASAAGEVAPSPLWVLDSPLLRRAMAEVNVPAVVAVVRAACGLSQRDMAEVAGWTPAVLSYYERGKRDAVFDVRIVLKFADAVGMPRGALVALVLGDPDVTSSLALDGGTARRAVTASLVRYWRACTDALHERDRHAGGTTMLGPAMLLRGQAAEAIRRADCAGLPAAEAEITLYASQAALDAADLIMAGSLADSARDLAKDAGDLVLAVHVMLVLSQIRAVTARKGASREPARQALLLAREAADEARYEPVPQLHALIAIRHAQAAALLGDEPVFDAAITRARRELGRGGLDDTVPLPAWLRHVGEAELCSAEAAGAQDLARTDRAVALYRHALDAADCPRDHALIATELACALIRDGDNAGAVAMALDRVVPALESGVASARCLDQLRQVTAGAGAVRGILELREKIEQLRRSVPGVPGPDKSPGARAALTRMPA